MIFVTVGTTDFDDLIKKIDEIAPELDQKVVAQIGRGSYTPNNCEYFRFAQSLDSYYEQADIVIAHGGLGTLIEVLERNKKLIGLSNPDRFDHHQEDLLKVFSERNLMMWCKSLDSLKDCIRNVENNEFMSYTPPECHIADMIKDYLHKIV